MRVRTADKDLLDAKTFLVLSLGDTEILLGDGAESIKIILEFAEEKEKKEELALVPIDAKTLRIRLTNWNNVLGTTLVDPMEIGIINRRKLFFSIFVKKAGDRGQVREVTFCAYLGAEVPDGQN